MNRIYLIIALRNLQKHKTTSLLSVFGLTIGIGACLVIYQYIHFELSYDKFHSNAHKIYRVTRTEFKNGEKNSTRANTPFALGVSGKEEIPEVENFIRIHPQYFGAIVTNPDRNEPFREEDILFADSLFLRVFDFSLKQGNPEKVLNGKYNIVITEAMAEKYFGADTDPVGKTLRVADGWANGDFTVTGVLHTLPANSHLDFDFLMPMQVLLESGKYRGGNGWGLNNFITYFTVDEHANVETIEKKLDQVVENHLGTRLASWNVRLRMNLQEITDVHLKSEHIIDSASNKGSMQDVKVFSIIAVFILVIAWVNFINLSTARSLERAKEVGIRKTIGAFRKQLIHQFMVESLLINLIAAILSISIAIIALPILNNITGKELTFAIFEYPEFWIKFAVVITVGSVVSGLYPAFVLSSFKPVSILKGSVLKQGTGITLRKGLIVLQFFLSAILISGTVLVYKQVSFMKNQDLGVNMQQILVINGPGIISDRQNLSSTIEAFKTKVLNHSSVLTASGSGTVPGKGHSWLALIRKMQDPPEANMDGGITYADFDFFETYKFQFLTGRPFDPQIITDCTGVVINEEAVKVFGLVSPEKAIHEKLVIAGGDTINVLGVVKNYHWNSLRDAYIPYLFLPSERTHRYFSFVINLSDISQSLVHIQSAFNAAFPHNPFDYFFLDDEFNRQYKTDLQFGKLFAAFSLLAISIACLGLFALVSFSATLRTKEIGIRKVLGAEVRDLLFLLSREYVLLLLIANIVAVPIIIYAGQLWLDNYAFRINIGTEIFILPGMILLVIAFLTVGNKLYLMAKSNPVNALRKE